MQREATKGEGSQQGDGSRHHSRQRPIRVVIEVIAVHRIPQLPEVRKGRGTEGLDEKPQPRFPTTLAAEPESQVLSERQPTGRPANSTARQMESGGVKFLATSGKSSGFHPRLPARRSSATLSTHCSSAAVTARMYSVSMRNRRGGPDSL